MSSSGEVVGCCPLDCQDTCSWVARVEHGHVAFHARRSRREVNDYQALLHPIKRVGRKGEGRFERITWGEALDTIAERFSRITNQYGGEALLPHRFAGSIGVVQRSAPVRLVNALGASRLAARSTFTGALADRCFRLRAVALSSSCIAGAFR
jgi:anaerobic selenocysteine-containing dehydrogenase